MFSLEQKREIANKVGMILRATNHPELPTGEIQFELHVHGSERWSYADIRNNGAVPNPTINPHNQAQDPRGSGPNGAPLITDETMRRLDRVTPTREPHGPTYMRML